MTDQDTASLRFLLHRLKEEAKEHKQYGRRVLETTRRRESEALAKLMGVKNG